MNDLVTVLIPAYNAGKYIADTLESICSQTYANLEILVVDDGSVDNTNEIVKALAEKDPRIVLARNEKNAGLIYTLNRGLDLAKGKYLARMDSDDIARKDRIETQMQVMLAAGTDMTGCLLKAIDEQGRFMYYIDGFDCRTHGIARFIGFFENPIAHPGILVKTAVINAFKYDTGEQVKHVEDYELFSRMLTSGVTYRCVNEYLLNYRINPDGASKQNSRVQFERAKDIGLNNIRNILGLEIDHDIYDTMVLAAGNNPAYSDVKKSFAMLDELKQRYIRKEQLSAQELRRISGWILQRKVKILKTAVLHGPSAADRIRSVTLLPHPLLLIISKATYFNAFNNLQRMILHRFFFK